MAGNPKIIRFVVRLDLETLDALSDLATAFHCSKSKAIRLAIRRAANELLDKIAPLDTSSSKTEIKDA